jgi:hypothetical protein
MNNNNPRISRNDAAGEWNTLIAGKTIYDWNGQLWTGRPYTQGYERGIELTPLSDEDREYLTKRGALPKIKSA